MNEYKQLKKAIKFILLILILFIGFQIYAMKIRPSIYPKKPVETSKPLILLNITPPSGENDLMFPGTAIQFMFDAPLDISTAQVSITPYLNISVELGLYDDNVLIVRPIDQWKYDVEYTIIIKRTLNSIDKKGLNNDIKHTVKFKEIKNIEGFYY